MKYIIGIILASVLLVACNQPEPTTIMQSRTTQTWNKQPVTYSAPNANIPQPEQFAAQNGRFTIVQSDVFRDSLAYGSLRGVYIIIDNKTGKEFVGVSGVGIAETGSHSTGKTSASDER